MSLTRRILSLAVPAFAALLAHPLMLLADTWIVGRLGTVQLAGLSIGSGLLLTVVGLSIFLAYGSTAVVARFVGAGRRRRGLEMGVQAIWVAAAMGALIAVVMWPLAPLLARALGQTPDRSPTPSTTCAGRSRAPRMLMMLGATGTFRGLSDARTLSSSPWRPPPSTSRSTSSSSSGSEWGSQGPPSGRPWRRPHSG
ncbi:hypothetical protein G7085_08130 [Tessaracoccus sp. HDW20]|uniref:MATE family efflux transporter n=1 Tax=Tessaracoccus coleopterorum TaxID=2714950 RepID=UPI0018D29CCF|nr:MATE family efflux transporter [Tessaracoccus coleopterorum]NHB84591.1 hypothetical protein [Tessaracoccus coleopterorum]